MGAYKRDQIFNDFRIATKGLTSRDIIFIEYVAVKILENNPDNNFRDFAISHLLKAAEMFAYAHRAEPLLYQCWLKFECRDMWE